MVNVADRDRLTFRRLSFFIPAHIDAGLKALKDRDGVAEAESIRRALVAYLRAKGVLSEPKGKQKSR